MKVKDEFTEFNQRFKRRKLRYRKLIWVSILFNILFRYLFQVSILIDTLFRYPNQESILFDISSRYLIWHVQCHCYPLFRKGIAFQLIFLAWPHLPRTIAPSREGLMEFWIFSFVTEVCLIRIAITRPGVELITFNHPQFQPPSNRFTSLSAQAAFQYDLYIFPG